jgi:hypothetical protein
MISTPPPSPLAKASRMAGLVCALIGALLCLLTAVSLFRTMDQPAAAQKNVDLVQRQWDQLVMDRARSGALAKAMANSTLLLARTNIKTKLTLVFASALLVGAGGLLWVSNKSRP